MERQEEEQVRGSEAELRGSKCGDWSGDLCATTDIAATGLLLPYITFSSHRCFPVESFHNTDKTGAVI